MLRLAIGIIFAGPKRIRDWEERLEIVEADLSLIIEMIKMIQPCPELVEIRSLTEKLKISSEALRRAVEQGAKS